MSGAGLFVDAEQTRRDFRRSRAVGIMHVVATPGQDRCIFVADDAGAILGLDEFCGDLSRCYLRRAKKPDCNRKSND